MVGMKLEEGTSHHTVNSGSLYDGQCILFHLPPVWGTSLFSVGRERKNYLSLKTLVWFVERYSCSRRW